MPKDKKSAVAKVDERGSGGVKMFSEKYGYKQPKEILYEDVSDNLRRRIWNLFYQKEILERESDTLDLERVLGHQETIAEKVADKFGFLETSAKVKLREFILYDSEWYEVYDFIDVNLSFLTGVEKKDRTRQYNDILEQEKAGYRIILEEVAPITNGSETETIEQAATTQFDSVNQHISKALALYADLKNPDYENSVKESISAVEAMCCIITGMSGKQATLGTALKNLEEHGVHIHKAMASGFNSLYGYASDENGIRHGGIDFKNVPPEDAKFMLVSCSAFVNYLIEKWSKVENN